MILELPYIPQRLPLFDPKSRYREVELDWWSDRACGIACCASIISTLTKEPADVLDLLHEAIGSDSFVKAGWVHRKLADLLKRRDLRAESIAIDKQSLVESLSSNVFICSVRLGFPEVSTEKGGHLVCCYGIDRGILAIMDPSLSGSLVRTVPVGRFFHSYSGRSIQVCIK